MRLKKKTIIFWLFAVAPIFMIVNSVMASGEYGTGGTGAGGSGDGDSDTFYQCAIQDKNGKWSILDVAHCPRWIKVSGAIYRDIISKNRLSPKANKYSNNLGSICQTDESVIIAGNQGYITNNLQIYNLNSGKLPRPTKISKDRRNVSVATGSSSDNGSYKISVNYFFDDENDDGLKGSDDKILTYQQILDTIIGELKKTEKYKEWSNENIEKDIAVFCPSMIATNVTLMAHGKIVGDANTIVWSNLDSDTVQSGSMAEVNVPSEKTKDGIPYVFNSWGSSCPADNRDGRKCIMAIDRDKPVYAYYSKKRFTLTAYAKGYDESGAGNHSSLNNGNSISSSTVYYGDNATVTSDNYNPTNWSWWKWGGGGACAGAGSNRSCTVNNLTSDTSVNAYYRKNQFSGASIVEDGSNSNNKSTNDLIKIDCSSGTCSAKFTLNIRQTVGTTGTGGTRYWVYKNDAVVDGKSNISIDTGSSWNSVYTKTESMTPGKRICYSIKYISIPADGNGTETKTSCAVAEAEMGSSISIEVRDQSSSEKYQEWNTNEIYAKPGDTIEMKGTFTPTYQQLGKVYTHESKIIPPDNSSFESNQTKSIRSFVNSKLDPDWRNAFAIVFLNECKQIGSGTIGSPDSYEAIYDGYPITNNDVGQDRQAWAQTNYCENIKNTPRAIKISWSGNNIETYNNSKLRATINNKPISSSHAHIKVPYNFSNSTTIDESEDERIVYAGETKGINAKFTVGTKLNNETNGTYATKVPNTIWQIWVQYDDDEWENAYEETGKTMNGGGKLTGIVESLENNVINIKDVKAGTRFCVKSKIYPTSSGSDKNINESGFSDWGESDPVCYIVAKKPSFQVWGGGLYSAYNIDLSPSPAIKNNLAEYNNYSPTGSNNTYVFGSFTELGITTTGSIKGLASGAATGYTTNNNGTLVAIPGGFNGGSDYNYYYCNLSPLSIPNNNCSGATGYVGISSDNSSNNNSTDTSDRSSLISRFTEDNATDEAFKNYTIVTPENCNGNDCTLEGIPNLNNYKGDTDNNGITRYTKVINAKDKTLTITENITYDPNQIYTDLETIPKIIIYAKNIKIACDVKQIDAVLIAEGDINTCYDAGDENDQKRSKQLTINGSIITDTLHLERTYGAATGNNSIVPAEIINYDSTLYLWANSQASSKSTGRLTESYMREKAPRY